MAIIVNFAGASLRKPGAYSRTKIASSGAADAQLGVVALIGEADEGPAFDTANMEASAYGPDQFADIQNQFGSGELVDMAKLSLAPSVDPQIAGGAQKLYLLKTNVGTKASSPFLPRMARSPLSLRERTATRSAHRSRLLDLPP